MVRLLFFLFFIGASLHAQVTVVKGVIFDGDPKEKRNTPMPGVNVYFGGTSIGTVTDFEGRFELKTDQKPTKLHIRFLGYQDTTLNIRPGVVNNVRLTLQPGLVLNEVQVVYRKRRPALEVIDSVKKYRRENDPFRFESVESDVYTKSQFDAYNLPEKFVNGKVTRAFRPIFDLAYVGRYPGDTTKYYPFLLSEMMSKIYKKRGATKREVIHKFAMTGVENDNFAQFLGTFQDFNFYDDNQLILGKTFVGPLNPAVGYYAYELTDTLYIDNMRQFRITFGPKGGLPKEMVYSGEMYVHDTTWAVTRFRLKMNPEANINFVSSFEIDAKFSRRPDGVWVLTYDEAWMDFNPKDFVDFSMNLAKKNDKYRVLIHRTRVHSNHVFNQPSSALFPKPGAEVDIIDGARVSKFTWDTLRPIELTSTEMKIDSAVTKVKKNPTFQFIYKIGDLVSSGYWNFGYFGYGPLYETWSMNEIEGHRIKVGGRTSDSISRRFFVEAHVTYGTRDERFKWDCSGVYHFNKDKNPWRMFGWRIRQDYEQLGLSRNQWRPDNFIGTFLRRRVLTDISFIDDVQTFYEHDWFTGLNSKLTLNWMRVYDSPFLRFGELDQNGEIVTYLPHFTRSEIKLETTLAYGQQWLRGRVKRRAIRGEYPAIKLEYTYGMKGVLGSNYEYHAVRCSIADRTRIKPLGYTDWEIQAGKIWGTIPYPLMEIHLGNDTYMYDMFGFNLMNYFEFVSDQYTSVRVEHFFDGLFFNKIPGIRKLKWREVIGAKMLVGSISDANKAYMALPQGTYELRDQRTGETMPYVEVHAGIENIFNVLRIDFVWRLTHQRGANPLDPGNEFYPESPRWGIVGGLSVKI